MVVFRKKRTVGDRDSYGSKGKSKGSAYGSRYGGNREGVAPSKFYKVLLSIPNNVLHSKNDNEYIRCSFIHPERGTVRYLYLYENKHKQLVNLLKSVLNSYSWLDKSSIGNINDMIELVQGLGQNRKNSDGDDGKFSMSMFVSALFEQIGIEGGSDDKTTFVLVPVTVAETKMDDKNFTYTICDPDKSRIYVSDTEFGLAHFCATVKE